ncbi:MAG: hypothetical protein Q8S35_00150 [bacterium]|nr:hypothetical protein [bacterium]
MTSNKRKKKVPAGPCKVKSLKSLRALLKRHGVNYADWGVGYTKTPQELMKEVRLGESLLLIKRGMLRRQARHSQASITCMVDGILYELVEDRQVFANGTVRRREGGRSVSEKIQSGESPKAAMIRGIHEELGLVDYTGEGLVREIRRPRRRSNDSAESYPGLAVDHIEFQFSWAMPLKYFCADGYVEVKRRKSTYFVWKVA